VVRAAVGLGSNLGDRAAHVAAGVSALAGAGVVVAVSSLYETAPIGGPEQGPYLNAVAVVDTDLTPHELLALGLEAERAAGRERRERWGPRPLDVDILLFGDQEIATSDLTIPHPRMTERRFVLEPLLEVWPDAALPDGTALAAARPAVAAQRVRKLETVVPDRRLSIALFFTVAVIAAVLWALADWLL
jgi:2-amino-4-hydroxy-6-hydroxymethyldihydropteridine diphosphokinase